MSRMYEALKKAAQQPKDGHRPPIVASANGGPAPDSCWNVEGMARDEYERIRVLMTTPGLGKVMRTIAVVGCRSGSGATTTATLLAVTLASSRRSRILLVDANLRTPSLDVVFSVSNAAGLTDVLADDKPADDCIQLTSRGNLFVLPAGGIPAYPAGIFERPAIEPFLQRATASFDFVIFDTAPVLQFPATSALASYVDGVLLVLHADRTPVEDAQRAKAELERVNACVLGAVLNRRQDYTPSVLRRLGVRT